MSVLVTIVIPSYNAGTYLREAVDSVLAQSYANVELIVLDDGSTDDTPAILSSYGERFHWESHTNRGQSATLNKGWAMANGEIISYLSADDALVPEAVEVAVALLNQQPEVVMAYGDYLLIDKQGRPLQKVSAPEFNYKKMVAEIEVQPGPGVFFRKEVFDRIGGWDQTLRQIPDFEYWLRLGLCGDFVRIPKELALYRVHDDSQSFAIPTVEKAEECVRVMAAYFQNPDLPGEIVSVERQSMAMAYLIAARFHLRAGRYRETWQHIWQTHKICSTALYSTRALRLLGNGIKFRCQLLVHGGV